MRVFLPGITGFIGDLLARRLIEDGHEVAGLSRYVSGRVIRNYGKARIYYGDLQDLNVLKEIVTDFRPEVIVNLAALSSVEYSFSHMHEVYQVDFVGLANLTTAATQCAPGLRKFIHASSVETYGNQASLPLRETMVPKPASPYGVAKVAAEVHLKYLYDGFDFPCVVFRSANTYGRRNNRYFVVEHIINQLLEKSNDVPMGAPSPIRDFLYIDDELDAYVRAIETKKDIFGEVINTGTDDGISIKDLFTKIEELVGFTPKRVRWNSISKRPFEIKALTMSYDKANKLLGWKPKYSLDKGLRKTIKWWETVRQEREGAPERTLKASEKLLVAEQ